MTDPDKKRERDRCYYRNHSEERKSYQREYYRKNMDKYSPGYKSSRYGIKAYNLTIARKGLKECEKSLLCFRRALSFLDGVPGTDELKKAVERVGEAFDDIKENLFCV